MYLGKQHPEGVVGLDGGLQPLQQPHAEHLVPDHVRVHDLDLEGTAAPPRRDPLGRTLDLGALLQEIKPGICYEVWQKFGC